MVTRECIERQDGLSGTGTTMDSMDVQEGKEETNKSSSRKGMTGEHLVSLFPVSS